MSDAKKDLRNIEGHYNYYGMPAYILKQKNGAYASGLYDCAEGVFKAGGSAKKILWDGIKIGPTEAKRLIERYSKTNIPMTLDESGEMPDWILLPEEASFFMAQSDKIRSEGMEFSKKAAPLPDKDKDPEKH
jgi:hypothetical protein